MVALGFAWKPFSPTLSELKEKRELAGNDNKKYISDVHVSWIFHAKLYLSSLKAFCTM
jgi:hypothetical protein